MENREAVLVRLEGLRDALQTMELGANDRFEGAQAHFVWQLTQYVRTLTGMVHDHIAQATDGE